MTLILAHQLEEGLAVITDGAGVSSSKCCAFPKHSAILPFWGYYHLCPKALNISPDQVSNEKKQLYQLNYIGDKLPHPKADREKFVAAFEAGLNNAENVHNGDGTKGSSGVLLAFACISGFEARVYDVNAGKGSWKLREVVGTWPVLFGQDYQTAEMLTKNYKTTPSKFIGPVRSIDDFTKKAVELIALTSDYLVSKSLERSVALPAWLVLLSKDGTISEKKL